MFQLYCGDPVETHNEIKIWLWQNCGKVQLVLVHKRELTSVSVFVHSLWGLKHLTNQNLHIIAGKNVNLLHEMLKS